MISADKNGTTFFTPILSKKFFVDQTTVISLLKKDSSPRVTPVHN